VKPNLRIMFEEVRT